MRLRIVVLTATCACAAIVLHAQQPPARGQAPAARHPAGSQHEPWHRSERQSHPAGAEDRARLELRREQGRPLHAARSAGVVGRQAGPERARRGCATATRDHSPLRDRDLRRDPRERRRRSRGRSRKPIRRRVRHGVHKRIVGRIGTGADAPTINLTLLRPGARQQAVADHPARELRRRRRRLPAIRRWPPTSSPAAGATRRSRYQDIQPDQVDTFDRGRDRRHARAGTEGAGSGRVGHDRRVVVGRQPDRRLPRHRPSVDAQAHRAATATRGSGRRRCGRRRSTSASPRSTRAAPARWAPRCRGATGARRSTTWRRTFPTGSRAISRSGRAAGTRCRSTRTC